MEPGQFNTQPINPAGAHARARREKDVRVQKRIGPDELYDSTGRIVLPAVGRPAGYEGPICTMDHHLITSRASAMAGDGGDPTRRRHGPLTASRLA